MQLVKYDQPRYLSVAFAQSPTLSRTIMLWPGINELSDKDWSDVKNHPIVKDIIKLGHLVEMDKRPGDESLLLTMTQDKAVELVQDTNNVDLLKKWLIEEKRHLVIRTISGRLNEMVLPDRRDKAVGETTEESDELNDPYPRADKLGHDKVAKKMAGKRAKR